MAALCAAALGTLAGLECGWGCMSTHYSEVHRFLCAQYAREVELLVPVCCCVKEADRAWMRMGLPGHVIRRCAGFVCARFASEVELLVR
jgi:sorbitol-specific phosphotransferase system component IIBC